MGIGPGRSMDEALRVAWRTALDAAVLLRAVHDAGGAVADLEYVAVNPAAETYLGRSADQLVGALISELFAGESADHLVQWSARAMAGEDVVLDEELLRSAVTGRPSVITVRVTAVGELVLVIWRDRSPQSTLDDSLPESERWQRMVADNATDVVLVTGLDGLIRWASSSVERTLGWDPAQVVGRPMPELVHPEDLAAQLVDMRALRAGPGHGRRMLRFRTAGGEWRWMSVAGQVLRDDDGNPIGGMDAMRDAQAEVEAQESLAASEQHVRMIAEQSTEVLFRAGTDSRVEWISPGVEHVLGLPPEQVVGRPALEWLHPEDLPTRDAGVARLEDEDQLMYQARFRAADGSLRWLDVSATVIRDAAGVATGVAGIARDVTEQRAATEALRASEERFRTALTAAPLGTAVLSLDLVVVEANPALCVLLGRTAEELQAHSLLDAVAEEDREQVLVVADMVRAGAGIAEVHEHRVTRPDGSSLWVSHSMAALRHSDGAPSGFVTMIEDVTAARAAGERLRLLAGSDPLTGLLNRRELLSRVGALLVDGRRSTDVCAVLFVDLDGLKAINDRHGHTGGDQVLVAVADTIRSVVRTDDLVARFGGDEYVVVLPTAHSLDDAGEVAAKIHRSLGEPLLVDGVPVPVTVSIGLAVVVPGDDVDAVLKRADRALYRAKRRGKSRTETENDGGSAPSRGSSAP